MSEEMGSTAGAVSAGTGSGEGTTADSLKAGDVVIDQRGLHFKVRTIETVQNDEGKDWLKITSPCRCVFYLDPREAVRIVIAGARHAR